MNKARRNIDAKGNKLEIKPLASGFSIYYFQPLI